MTTSDPPLDPYTAPPAGEVHRPPAAHGRNGLGVAALVLGILAILASITVIGGVIFGLLALIFGFIGRGRAKRGEATNGGIALAGAITGLIGLLLSVALITFGVSILNSNSGKNYQSCLKQATNQAAQQACAQQFGQQLTK